MDDWQRRWRAAAALAGYDFKQLATELGVSVTTLDRNISKATTRKQRREREGLARDIAETCGLTYEFFIVDFKQLGRDPQESELTRQMEGMEGSLRAMKEAIDQVGAQQRAALPKPRTNRQHQ